MTKNVSFDYSKAASYISEEVLANMKKRALEAKEVLVSGTGAGAVYSFSMLTPTDYEAVAKMNPILFMNGDKDRVITDSARVNLRAALPEGSVDYVVKGGGHMFTENMAEEAARVTLEFLAQN